MGDVRMAKINASKLKSAATMAGVRKPVAPAPAGVRIQKPSQMKQAAKARAKARMKMLIRVLIFAAIAAIIALVIYFVKFYGRQPKDAFKTAIEYAYKDNTVKFSSMFTEDSILLVEDSDGDPDKVWEHLMDQVTPPEKPKVVKEVVEEENGIKSATLTVKIDNVDRTIHMMQEDGSWKINLNVAINPSKVDLPDDIPPQYIENFKSSEKPEPWWDHIDDEEGGSSKDKSKKSSGGFFSKFRFF